MPGFAHWDEGVEPVSYSVVAGPSLEHLYSMAYNNDPFPLAILSSIVAQILHFQVNKRGRTGNNALPKASAAFYSFLSKLTILVMVYCTAY